MRPISIGYRSPKEKTPLSYDVFIDKRSGYLFQPTESKIKENESKSKTGRFMGGQTKRFADFNRYLREKACQPNVGPGSYNDHNQFVKLTTNKGALVMKPLEVPAEHLHHYKMIDNLLVYDPDFQQKEVPQPKWEHTRLAKGTGGVLVHPNLQPELSDQQDSRISTRYEKQKAERLAWLVRKSQEELVKLNEVMASRKSMQEKNHTEIMLGQKDQTNQTPRVQLFRITRKSTPSGVWGQKTQDYTLGTSNSTQLTRGRKTPLCGYRSPLTGVTAPLSVDQTDPSHYLSQNQEFPARSSVVSFLSSKISKKRSPQKPLDMIVLGGDNLINCNDFMIRSSFQYPAPNHKKIRTERRPMSQF